MWGGKSMINESWDEILRKRNGSKYKTVKFGERSKEENES